MTGPARRLAYTVRAEHPDRDSAERYLRWLVDGHIQAVLGAGGESGHAVLLDAEGGPPTIEVRYVFPSRGDFDRYVAVAAPRLRAEGLALFGPETGVRYTRSLGEIHEPSAP